MFRRMGLADKIRAAGLPADVPMDVYVILAMNEPPLLRLPYPSVAEARTFLEDKRTDKRARLVEELLAGPRYNTHFTNVWRALLLPEEMAGQLIEKLTQLAQFGLTARGAPLLRSAGPSATATEDA